MQKKLNTLTLSGLMIGPILGSGIVLLPPLAIKTLGNQAIFAWLIIMALGVIFAYIFAKMSLKISSNEGMSIVIGQELGQFFRELSANYLTTAVCFGPVAVALTASEFLSHIVNLNLDKTLLACIVLLLCVTVLLGGITTVGKLTLVLSSLTAALLVTGSVYSLLTQVKIMYPTGLPEPHKLGYTLLLLFWAIIGWEVIGNYVEEVDKPEKTIMRSMKVSVVAITIVYVVSAFALQNRMQLQEIHVAKLNMSLILIPLFGDFAYILMGIIAAGLCFCTLLMILGAVTRQIAVRAENGKLPAFFKMKLQEKAPKHALFVLSGWHCILLVLIYFKVLSIEGIVGIANTFFIGNALLGLAASIKYMKEYWVKFFILILIIALIILIGFSSAFAWIALVGVTAGTIYKSRRNTNKKDKNGHNT